MAAPQIPNLNSLRNPLGAGRGRGRGRGRGGHSDASPEEERAANDRIVQQTDQDASVSRLSAVEVGYLDDPFAKYFASTGSQRKFPIINRGTYVRTKAVDNLVDKFLAHNPAQKKQIISLGAGSDTRFFRLMSRTPYEHPNLLYHEIDFPENTFQKLGPQYKEIKLREHIVTPFWSNSNPSAAYDAEPDTLLAGNYCVHPVDLRTLDPSRTAPPSFDSIDKALPTLIISECCLCYLAPAAADAVALYFTQHLFPSTTPLGLVLYEPIEPNDAFGEVMVSNLAARGIVLQTLRKYGSLEAQAARMKAYGFEGAGGANVSELWKKGVDEKEKERVAGLEMVDEVEEWELLAGHYCVVWAWRGEGEGLWEGWRDAATRLNEDR